MDRDTLDLIVTQTLVALEELAAEIIRLRSLDEVSVEDIENAFDQISRAMIG